MNPVSVLHDNVSVKFVQPEFHCLNLSVQGTKQQQSCTCDSRNTEVLVKLSLIYFSNTKSTDWNQVSNPCKYCKKNAWVEEEHNRCSWEGIGFHISLKEVIPISCKHESKIGKSNTFVHYQRNMFCDRCTCFPWRFTWKFAKTFSWLDYLRDCSIC